MLEQLELTGRGSWRVHLDSGAALKWGGVRLRKWHARVQRFLKTLTQVTRAYGRHAMRWSRPTCGTKTAMPSSCAA